MTQWSVPWVFFFCLIYCRLGRWKSQKLGNTNGTNNKSSRKSLLSFTRGPWKEQPTKTKKTLKYYLFYSSSTSRLHISLPMPAKGRVGSLDFYSHQSITRYPNTLHWGSIRECQVGNRPVSVETPWGVGTAIPTQHCSQSQFNWRLSGQSRFLYSSGINEVVSSHFPCQDNVEQSQLKQKV